MAQETVAEHPGIKEHLKSLKTAFVDGLTAPQFLTDFLKDKHLPVPYLGKALDFRMALDTEAIKEDVEALPNVLARIVSELTIQNVSLSVKNIPHTKEGITDYFVGVYQRADMVKRRVKKDVIKVLDTVHGGYNFPHTEYYKNTTFADGKTAVEVLREVLGSRVEMPEGFTPPDQLRDDELPGLLQFSAVFPYGDNRIPYFNRTDLKLEILARMVSELTKADISIPRFVSDIPAVYRQHLLDQGIETPEPISETIEDSETEIEKRAKELAHLTRQEGVGALEGKFPPKWFTGNPPISLGKHLDHPLNTGSVGGFMKGEVLETFREVQNPFDIHDFSYQQGGVLNIMFPYNTEPHVFGWVVNDYKPYPRTTQEYPSLGNIEDWVSYSYVMPISHAIDESSRPLAVDLKVAVPSFIAEKIDEAVSQNSAFPEYFFQALYPGLTGDDPDKSITRYIPDQLLILDRRKARNESDHRVVPLTGVINDYPQSA